MNLFILDEDPTKAAQLQCDKHVVKMIIESAQMLSTAHRMLDGYVEKRPSKSGKRIINYWVHPKDAELVISMISKQSITGVTKAVVMEAFPGLIHK